MAVDAIGGAVELQTADGPAGDQPMDRHPRIVRRNTGRVRIGTVSRWTERLIESYLKATRLSARRGLPLPQPQRRAVPGSQSPVAGRADAV